MAVSYKPLWKTLIDKDIKRMELMRMADFSTATLSKLGKDEYVALSVLDNICNTLNCRIEDVIEMIPQKKEEEVE